jgi:DNA-directed RNA polymerase specialized sigma24 family protein
MEDPVTMNISTDLRKEFDNKIKRGIFNPVARFLPEDVREDRLQDAIAQTWAMYERYAQRGELLDDAILVHSCGLRATDASRYYVPCEGYQRKRDALDPRNFMEGHVELLRFGDFDAEDEHRGPDEDEAPGGFGLTEATSSNPMRRIISAINLTAWLAKLPVEDRHMLELRAAGLTLDETAEKIGVSTSNVFARCKRLGLALAERAGICVKPKQKVRKTMKDNRRQGPISETRPVRKAGARSGSRPSSSRRKETRQAA